MRKRFTIGDVAKLAGVGKVTVSYVLNGRGEENRISKETQERIHAAARELEYRPSAVARSLVSKRSNAISVVFQYANYFQAGSSFINELMRGVCEECVEADINLILHTRTFRTVEEEAHALMDGRTDGALVLRDVDDPLLPYLRKHQFPIVTFFSRPPTDDIPFVDSDNVNGAITATNYLRDLNHNRIGMVTGSAGSVASNDRLKGYKATMGEAFHEDLVLSSHTEDDFNALFMDWIRTQHPTAILCWSDDTAFGCMRILQQNGLKVPEDISVMGFDSSEACDRSTPTLTSMRQPIFEIARSAARTLILATKQAPAESHQIFPQTLDIRGSTQPLPIKTSSVKRKP
jgi:DNA-binding LacI/PurR family transcriptional regulator